MFGANEIGLTKRKDLARALNPFRVLVGTKRIGFVPKSKNDMGLDFDAIVGTRPRQDNSWHWMVWDSINQKLLDPDRKDRNYRVVTHYIKIMPAP